MAIWTYRPLPQRLTAPKKVWLARAFLGRVLQSWGFPGRLARVGTGNLRVCAEEHGFGVRGGLAALEVLAVLEILAVLEGERWTRGDARRI